MAQIGLDSSLPSWDSWIAGATSDFQREQRKRIAMEESNPNYDPNIGTVVIKPQGPNITQPDKRVGQASIWYF